MSITEVALTQTRVTLAAVVVLLAGGLSAYTTMPKKMDPGFSIRNAQVITQYPGASPANVEKLVTDPLETAILAMAEIKNIESTSRLGLSLISVEYRDEFTNLRPIFDELRRKVQDAAPELPSDIKGPIVNDELGDIYPLIFSMSSDGFSDRELSEIAEKIRDQILKIEGTAKVELLGQQEERVFVEFDDARLEQLGISASDLAGILSTRNIIEDTGAIDIGPETIPLEASGNFLSLEELGSTLLTLPSGAVVPLDSVTTIYRDYVDPRETMVRFSGERALAIAVCMQDGGNLLEFGERVKAHFDGLDAVYPHGLDFELAYYQPSAVEKKIDDFTTSVLQAIAIVLVVMLTTLGLRTGLIVSALIPSAMIIAILYLGLINSSINQMSLAALIIALGLLVDNAIVVTESVLVRMGRGETAFKAAVESCSELQVPLLISSLTTAAAFLPIRLAEHAVSEYTGILFTVVTVTLLSSWLLAITFIPLLCVWFMRAPPTSGDQFGSLSYRSYRSMLRFVLRHRVVSLAVVIALFVGSLPVWGLVEQNFFPAMGRPFFMAELSLPYGANIEKTSAMSQSIDAFIRDELVPKSQEEEGVTGWTTFVGETPPAFTLGYTPSPSLSGFSEVMLRTSSVEVIPEMMEKLRRFVKREFPDVRSYIRELANGPPVDMPVEIRLSGSNEGVLFDIASRVKAKLADIDGVRDVGDDWGSRRKKLIVSVDENRARRAGVSNQDVASSVKTYLRGMETTRFRDGEDQIPVQLRSIGDSRRDLDRVRNLSVITADSSVPLAQVADLDLTWEYPAIHRRDRFRTVTANSNVEGKTAMTVFQEIQPWLEAEAESWPPGYFWAFGGDFESSQEANQAIGAKLPIAGLAIVFLLVLQFNSFRKPVIVLSAIVLGLVGVVGGLFVMNSVFGFMALLGVVSLAGIVINNAIVLLDRIQLELDAGHDPETAIIGASQQRVRPILLTTATTVASLIPLYVSGGAMWEPLAVVIMFGLVFSTLMTLLVVPLLYAILYRAPVPAQTAP